MARLSTAAPIAAAVLGAFVATAVVGYFNYHAVLRAMAPVGWGGSVLIVAAQLVLMGFLGAAWFLVSPDEPPGHLGIFIWGRLMREAASDVLPFSQLGGFVISTRAMILGGVTGARAVASGAVDLTVEIVAQIIYTLVGVGLLILRLGGASTHDGLIYSVLAGLVLAGVMVVGFVFAQRRGLAPLERLAARFAPGAAAQSSEVNRIVAVAYRRTGHLWLALGAHLGCWVASAWGTWLILWLIDRPLPIASVIAIESLLFAIKNAAFIVPTGLGVQEGAYALLGPLFGLPPEAALALSLIKRGRDIAIGVPALLVWQMSEGRRTRVRASA